MNAQLRNWCVRKSSNFVYMCVCVCVCMCVCMYVCMHVCVCVCHKIWKSNVQIKTLLAQVPPNIERTAVQKITQFLDKKRKAAGDIFERYVDSSYIIHHTSYIIHHTSYIIHHTSYIIHHTSYVIHHSYN